MNKNAMKPKIKYVPTRGLEWTKRYAAPGDMIAVWKLVGNKPVQIQRVNKVTRNKYGRISYGTDFGYVMTEELSPYTHRSLSYD